MTLELKNIVEAILFAAERQISVKDMRTIFAEATDEENPAAAESFRNVREAQIAATLEELKIEYDTRPQSFQLVEIAGGWRLVSRAEHSPWLKKLLDEARPHRLSLPALETLAIVALRQPISRADIAGIRGVEVDGVVKTLLERDLITIVGRSNVPGKPLLYGTTQRFLEHFGLRGLDDMPKAAELRLQAAALRTAEVKTGHEVGGATDEAPVSAQGEATTQPSEAAVAEAGDETDEEQPANPAQ